MVKCWLKSEMVGVAPSTDAISHASSRIAEKDGVVEANEITEKNSSPSFFQIRNRFEEKSKMESVNSRTTASSTSPGMKSVGNTEFQQLYPIFKEHFTKRQFAAMENCFKAADKNEDGFLEPKEIKQMLIEYDHPVNLCDADVIVSVGDHDQDGKLSPKEFIELCKPTAESLKQQQHMEGSFPLSDKEFIGVMVQKLRSFVNPVSSKVKGTRQFFESMISNGTNVVAVKDKNLLLKRPFRRHSSLQEPDMK